MTESKIILLKDILTNQERKRQELAFYESELSKLQIKLSLVRHEIEVTEKIIDMIQTESVTEVKR